MKCKDCRYCSKRGTDRFYCDKDNSVLNTDDYYKGRKMDCSETQKEDDGFFGDYILWEIARK